MRSTGRTIVRAIIDDDWQHTNAHPSVDALAEDLACSTRC